MPTQRMPSMMPQKPAVPSSTQRIRNQQRLRAIPARPFVPILKGPPAAKGGSTERIRLRRLQRDMQT